MFGYNDFDISEESGPGDGYEIEFCDRFVK
jgi:hypothetical protein